MSKPKIAIVNVFFPPHAIGGATRVVVDNISVLQSDYSDKYDLVVFTTDADMRESHKVRVYPYNGIRVYEVGAVWRDQMDWHPRDPNMGDVFGQFLEQEKPDIIHFHCIQRLGANLAEVAMEFAIPYIVTVHDAWWISDFQFLVDNEGVVYPDGHPDPFVPIPLPQNIARNASLERRSYLKSIINQADQVLVVSEAFAKIYQQNGVRDVVVNENGLTPKEWQGSQTSSNGKVRIGHIGGMSNHKGFHIFKNGLDREKYHNLEAIVIDHSQPYGYEKIEVWNSVPVKILGKFPQDRIAELYSQIDVLSALSIWPESYGLVTREAISVGKWVIASNMGALGECVVEEENGHVIDVTENGSFVKLLKKIDSQPEKYMSSHDFREVPLVTKQVSELVAIYDRCIGGYKNNKQYSFLNNIEVEMDMLSAPRKGISS